MKGSGEEGEEDIGQRQIFTVRIEADRMHKMLPQQPLGRLLF